MSTKDKPHCPQSSVGVGVGPQGPDRTGPSLHLGTMEVKSRITRNKCCGLKFIPTTLLIVFHNLVPFLPPALFCLPLWLSPPPTTLPTSFFCIVFMVIMVVGEVNWAGLKIQGSDPSPSAACFLVWGLDCSLGQSVISLSFPSCSALVVLPL